MMISTLRESRNRRRHLLLLLLLHGDRMKMVLLLFNVIQFGVSEQRTTFCAHQQLEVGVVVAAGTRMRVYCARVNNFCVALPSSCARHTHSIQGITTQIGDTHCCESVTMKLGIAGEDCWPRQQKMSNHRINFFVPYIVNCGRK